jgi:hypothetical protein
LNMDRAQLQSHLVTTLRHDAFAASIVLAAARMDEDVENKLIPPEFGNIEHLGKKFGEFLSLKETSKIDIINPNKYDIVSLPPFLKEVLISILKKAKIGEKTENLK